MSGQILIVDDSAMIRIQVKRALTGAGFDVAEATDGQDAWEKLSGGPGDVRLVVCDVNMPRMNGLELLERLRDHGGFTKLPVLMLTTEGQPELIQLARSLGAKGWLVKPFKPELLVAAVQKIVGAAVAA